MWIYIFLTKKNIDLKKVCVGVGVGVGVCLGDNNIEYNVCEFIFFLQKKNI